VGKLEREFVVLQKANYDSNYFPSFLYCRWRWCGVLWKRLSNKNRSLGQIKGDVTRKKSYY